MVHLNESELNRQTLLYNEHFKGLNRKYGFNDNSLCDDDPLQTLYPCTNGLLNTKKMLVSLFVDSFSNIINVNFKKNSTNVDNIFDQLEIGNVLIITNHATFAGYPILIDYFNNQAKKRGIKNFNSNIFTILGPLLLTNSPQRSLICGINNVIKTIPDTDNGYIQGGEEISKIIRGNFLKEMKKRRENSKGGLYIMTPTGTRDYVQHDNTTGEAKQILFEGDKDIIMTINVIRKLAKFNFKVFVAGVNDFGIKNPLKVNPTGNEWCCGDVFLSIEKIEQSVLNDKNSSIMDILARNIFDSNGNVIGKTCDKEKLRKIKKGEIKLKHLDFSKINKKVIKKSKNFNDLRRLVVRSLYRLLYA